VGRPGNGTENVQTLAVLAELQLATGKTAEGEKTMARALARPEAAAIDLHGIARFQQMAGNTELAKRIFFQNAKRFPNQWPVNVGLARAYAISGDNKQAVVYAKKALAQAPDETNRKNLENLIKQWSATAAK
jgi:tetratricopeptide (TPR) repeat protein